jgi:endonuclease YncB( thermonuclease family)
MSPALKTLFYGGLAYLLAACVVQAQNTGTAKPSIDLDFSKDPCGNPMMESQLWYSIEGKVSKVVDGHTILLALADAPHVLRVHLAGIVLDDGGPFSKTAKEHLADTLLNKPVGVLVNPDQWIVLDQRPEKITGVVRLSEGAPSDIALTLLAEGLVRFKRPRPYTMSAYTTCQYRRAEAEAKSKKVGLWQ